MIRFDEKASKLQKLQGIVLDLQSKGYPVGFGFTKKER